jgi:hypothetical protein
MTDEQSEETVDLFNALKEAASLLVSAMETCHHCKASLLVDEGPLHCEDCSVDCDDHDPPDCVSLAVLHTNLKRVLHSCL